MEGVKWECGYDSVAVADSLAAIHRRGRRRARRRERSATSSHESGTAVLSRSSFSAPHPQYSRSPIVSAAEAAAEAAKAVVRIESRVAVEETKSAALPLATRRESPEKTKSKEDRVVDAANEIPSPKVQPVEIKGFCGSDRMYDCKYL